MDPREERGVVIAATNKLTQKGPVWLVPSQSGRGKYTVCPDPTNPFCSCPDHEETGGKCKHIFAVEIVMRRETGQDGTVTETKAVTFTQKKTYRQDWPAYNLAQTEEKARFMVLVKDLCRGLPEPPQPQGGRQRTPIADIIFACCLKVYTTLSTRRFATDLADAHAKGFLGKKMHPMMVCAFLESEYLTPVLHDLITKSALPLKMIETTFAPDSTGFATSRFTRWFDVKYGGMRSGKDWVKAHAICGVKTNVVTAVRILDKDAADSPQFGPLVEATAAAGFNVQEVLADKAYLSHENLATVAALAATPFIPFKSNSTPGEPGSLWEKMYLYYSLRREEFGKHYNQRSNAESTFSMVKAKFRDHVRSKTDQAMKVEVLVKFLCHNVCCLIQSQVELGIEPVFWGEHPPKAVEVKVVEPAAPVAKETPVVWLPAVVDASIPAAEPMPEPDVTVEPAMAKAQRYLACARA